MNETNYVVSISEDDVKKLDLKVKRLIVEIDKSQATAVEKLYLYGSIEEILGCLGSKGEEK